MDRGANSRALRQPPLRSDAGAEPGSKKETDMMNGWMMDGWGMTWGIGLFCLLVLVLLALGLVALVKYLRA
jgi:hypothetical protein